MKIRPQESTRLEGATYGNVRNLIYGKHLGIMFYALTLSLFIVKNFQNPARWTKFSAKAQIYIIVYTMK